MAGYTNYAFRQVVREFGGAGLLATEMIAARSATWLDTNRGEHPDRLWGVRDEPRPLAVQMWDNDPDNLAQVGRRLARDFEVSVVDLNFGCPVRQVTEKAHSGSWLLRDPARVGQIVARVVEACGAQLQDYVRVSNPVAPEVTRMRRHVLPSLLATVENNLRQRADVRLVETGKGYHAEMKDEHGLPHEVRELALVFARREGAGPHPYGELREHVQHLLRRLGYPVELSRAWSGSDQPWVHPARAVAVDRDGSPVGYVAHLNPWTCKGLGLPREVAIATIDVRALHANGRAAPGYVPVPVYPGLPVDVALLVDASTSVGEAAEFLRATGRKLIRDVELFEVYRGEHVPDGKKSLNFTVTLGADDRTLSDKDEGKFLDKVRKNAEQIGAELRG